MFGIFKYRVDYTKKSCEGGKLTKEEIRDFDLVFPELVEDIVSAKGFVDMPRTNVWMEELLQYNVPHGKKTRGMMTVMAYKALSKDLTPENLRLAYVLGWCVEILQAFALLLDDIMDGSKTRRGQPCWYLRPKVGSGAINDGLLLEHSMYAILKKYFWGNPYYTELIQLFLDNTFKTAYGQSLDTQMGDSKDFTEYTMETYESIVKYKTSHYTFCFPVFLAMAMAGVKNPELQEEVEKVLLAMGQFFQVQDDFLDCYGTEAVTGKIGTDIQDGKCSFLLVKALEVATNEQRQVLLENVGIDDPKKIQIVKDLYNELGLPKIYHEFELEQYQLISNSIKELENYYDFPSEFLQGILGKLFRRQA